MSPLFGTIYDSVLIMAHAVRRVREAGEWMSGGNLARHTRSLALQGFTLPLRTNASGAGLAHYLLLDTDGKSPHLYPDPLSPQSGLL